MSVLICVNEGDDMLLCVIEFMSMFGSGCESVGIQSSKSLQTINAGEGVEKRECSCTAGGNVN